MDLYGYCLNDPLNFEDPWGLIRIITFIEGSGGGTYAAAVTVFNTETNTVEFVGHGSTFPNFPGIQNTVAQGIYDGTRTRMDSKDKPGIFMDTTPTAPGSPNRTADEIFVHCGETASWRGSSACLTIAPSECNKFFALFGKEESVQVVIERVEID